MSIKTRHLDDKILTAWLNPDEQVISSLDNNQRARLLYRHQQDPAVGYPRLINNLRQLALQISTDLTVSGIPVTLMYNTTRSPSIRADTFIYNDDKKERKCVLCHLDEEQRGVLVLDRNYLLLANPGITFPGDLTIAATQHDPQKITSHVSDMLVLANQLYDYSIYFNGALAGATCPHLHFQASLKDRLIGEVQLQRLTKGQQVGPAYAVKMIETPELQVYKINNYLRYLHLITSRSAAAMQAFINYYLDILTLLNHEHIHDIPNIPDFGTYIDTLNEYENEARLNMMITYDISTSIYLAAIFPKTTNRPSSYFRLDEDRLLLGLAIKEALGLIITCREKDYTTLRNSPLIIKQAYQGISITDKMYARLNIRLNQLK